MAQQTINIGTAPDNGTGDPGRTAFTKTNSNFTELYTSAKGIITPIYVAGNWYTGLMPSESSIAVGAVPGANSIRLHPFFVTNTITINALGVRLTTLAAGGNIQCAIYANNAATGRPTGTALASTASITTAATGNVNAAVNVQLTPGMYWQATNMDNGTATAVAFSGTSLAGASIIGSATQANSIAAGPGTFVGLGVSQTFGTWPDLTAASFTEQVSVTTIPVVQFKVASIP